MVKGGWRTFPSCPSPVGGGEGGWQQWTPHVDPGPPRHPYGRGQPLFSPRWGAGTPQRQGPTLARLVSSCIRRFGSLQLVVFPFLFSGAGAPLTTGTGQTHRSCKKQPIWTWLPVTHRTPSFSLHPSCFRYRGNLSPPHATPCPPAHRGHWSARARCLLIILILL